MRLRSINSYAVYLMCGWLCLSSCTFDTRYLEERAHQASIKGDYLEALNYYQRAVEEHQLKGNKREAARVLDIIGDIQIRAYQLHDAVGTYRRLRRLLDEAGFIEAQLKLVRLLAKYLGDYQAALLEAFKLLPFNLDRSQYCELRYFISFSLMQLGNTDQAAQELQDCLRDEATQLSNQQQFAILSLALELDWMKKKYSTVIDRLIVLIKNFPEENKDHQLDYRLALAYEENKEFEKAQEVLEGLKATASGQNDYLNFRLKRLEFKMKSAAGARLRKKNL